MKSNILFSLVTILFLNLACCKSNQKITSVITPEGLEIKKKEILNYVTTFKCTESGGCSFLAFGSKACGGPKEYLVFPNSVDFQFLNSKVTEYNLLENQYNKQTNANSDCALVLPPNTVGCIKDLCTILN